MTTDTLLTPAEVWSGKIYSNGWKKPRYAFANRGRRFLTNYDEWLAGQDPGTADVTEKATGAKLGEIGIASPEDVSAAAATAREAQKEWAKVPGPKRGDVLRELSRLILARPRKSPIRSSGRRVRSGQRQSGSSRWPPASFWKRRYSAASRRAS